MEGDVMSYVRMRAIVVSLICFFGGNTHAEPLNYVTIFQDQPHQNPESPFAYVNPQAPQGGTIVLGALGTYDTFYPFFLKGSPAQGEELLYATLFKSDKNETGAAYPYVAESIEVLPNQVIFKIRTTATFQDGTPIRASDIVFSFNFLVKNKPSLQQYYQAIKEVTARDAQTVVFDLKDKAPKECALILSQIPVLSERFFTSKDVEKKPLTLPVGSGPYAIKNFKQGQFVVYEKVANWWGKDLPVNQGTYNFQSIRFDYFRDLAVFFEAFKKGEVDVFVEPTAKNWIKGYDFAAVKDGKIKKEDIPVEGIIGYSFLYNVRNPLFQDINVRKALALVFPFEEINATLFSKSYDRIRSIFPNTGAQAYGPPSPDELSVLQTLDAQILPPGVLTDPIEQWSIQVESDREKKTKAMDLLAQSGWRLKNGIQIHPEKGPFTFTFLVSNPIYDKVLQRMKGALASIGVTMNIKLQEPSQYTQTMLSFGFDMTPGMITASSSIPGNELLAFLGSASADVNGGRNWAGIKNPVVDTLIEKILAASSYEELSTLCKVLDRVVMASYYAIPGWTPTKMHLASWDKFGRPEQPLKQGVDFMTWWAK
jgi:microcin C transport system substrate-binding protein